MTVCAVIVAGGRSSRMGRDKAFESVRGRSIISRVITSIEGQVSAIAINANDGGQAFAAAGLPIISDLRRDIRSPLAGLHAALVHADAQGYEAVLTVPCDVPFLPADLVARLNAANQRAAVAESAGQQHWLTGLWSTTLLPDLTRAMDMPGAPRLQDWARMCKAAAVTWPGEPYDPFFNVNTPEELAEAEQIAAEFQL